MTEQEEFEFRLRLEREQSAKPKPMERTLGNMVRAGVDGFVQQTKDALGGAVRGAGSIGATVFAPQDALQDAITRSKNPAYTGNRNDTRRADMTAGTEALGADPDSLTYGATKLFTEVGGTLGVGGAASKFAPKSLPTVRRAVATAGFGPGAGNLATRTAAGGTTGFLSAGLVDPQTADTGFMVGAALPPAIKVAGKTGELVGKGIANATKNTLGLTTGVGAEPISQAFKAGATKNKDFLDNISGDVPLTDVLDRAKQGLSAMNAAKNAEYRSGMIPIAGDKTTLSLSGIDKAVQDAFALTAYKGQVKNESANAAVTKMRDIVDEWKSLDPAQFHTPEGLDALKQKLGGVLESIPFQEKAARLAAGKVYNAAKSEIQAQAPTYAKVMKDYQAASEQISEIERALSLGNKASADTAMRKLQSLMRNNVQTNYGNRLNLANTLEQQGGVELMPSLSGQALNSWTPRSLSGQLGAGATMGAAFISNPLAVAALPFQSPRLVGTAAYGAGRAFGATRNALSGGAPQIGAQKNALLQQLFSDPAQQFLYRAAPVAASQ